MPIAAKSELIDLLTNVNMDLSDNTLNDENRPRKRRSTSAGKKPTLKI